MPPSSAGRSESAAQLEPWVAFDRAMALAEFAPDGRLVFANDRFRELLGLAPELVGTLRHAQLCPPDAAEDPAGEAMWRSLRAGRGFSGVVERVRMDGSRCRLEMLYAPVQDGQGQLAHIVVVATEVAHARRTELAREGHLWRLSLVADATDAAIVITDAHSGVVYSNEGFRRMFGWTVPEMRGRKMLELIAPQTPVELFERVRGDLREGRPAEMEEVVTGKGGGATGPGFSATR